LKYTTGADAVNPVPVALTGAAPALPSASGRSHSGHPAQILLRYAGEGDFDLIVLGHKGHSGLWGRFLGHITAKVSENAHCSVLLLR
jgi:nucleotide-binding universal stress UspA family protein